MSEAKASILAFVLSSILVTVVCGGLMVLNVQGELIAVAFLLTGGLGAYLQSWVVMHYGPPDEGRHR